MELNKVNKTISLGRKYAYESTNESYLDKIERDLYKVIYEDKLNQTAVETLAKFLFERKNIENHLFNLLNY